METKDEKDYEQYEWIYYFFDGYDVNSFNNEIMPIIGTLKTDLKNFEKLQILLIKYGGSDGSGFKC